jgi:hypothetical protein
MSNKNTNIYLDAKTSFLEPAVNQYGGHMVMTNVKKATRVKYVNIDTRFADDYSKTGYYTFTFPEKQCNIKGIRIVTVETPISFYNISASLGNNSFQITQNDNTYKIVTVNQYFINKALYTVNNIDNITYKINLITKQYLPDVKVSYTSNSQNFDLNYTTITTTDNNNYTINFNTDPSGNIDNHDLTSKLGRVLGFKNASYTFNSSTPLVAESTINLNTLRYLYLVVDEFSTGFTNSFICPLQHSLLSKKILGRIALDNMRYPYGSVQVSNTFNALLSSDIRQYNGAVDIQKIQVQLINEYGAPVDLNGQDFSFLLEMTYE